MKFSFLLPAMSPSASPSFVTRIRNQLHVMHPAERRLAEFVLNFPGELASYSASELARLANVSNATVTRFVQKLGYATYEEARRRVRAEQQTGAALFMAVSGADTAGDTLHAHLEQAQTNLAKTFASLSLADVDAVARAMLDARRVWTVGFRTSHSFASYLQWQTLQVIESITALPGAGQTMGEHIASMRKTDVVVVFGLRRRMQNMDKILEQIVASGAEVVLISDEGLNRLAGPKWHFQCQSAAPGPLFNHVAVLALCHLLATRVIELAGAAGRRRLTAIEASHDALNEL